MEEQDLVAKVRALGGGGVKVPTGTSLYPSLSCAQCLEASEEGEYYWLLNRKKKILPGPSC